MFNYQRGCIIFFFLITMVFLFFAIFKAIKMNNSEVKYEGVIVGGSLKDLNGKLIEEGFRNDDFSFFIFFDSTCLHCKEKIIELKKGMDDFKLDKFRSHFFFVSREDKSVIYNFVVDNELSWDNEFVFMWDKEGKMFNELSIFSVPTVIVLDKNGNFLKRYEDDFSWELIFKDYQY